MIVLDTNVVSEALKPGRDPAVIAWLDQQSVETLFLSATSLAELLIGIAIMPDGKRKSTISAALDSLITRLFDTRILPFDEGAAMAYSQLVSAARAQGKAISMPDGQIGAIASVHNFSVATRDVAPFQALGVPVIDPWTAP
ncbi:MAG TPA: type II toxin-antitoxin system VapC family toxin [Candidatus Melainabacteria bacterium]|jgi:toxin FitB|nr:type II toxin-antitoxin system VapC family toxin [Candidatus Melainabacteria bacterium]HIN67369.1 type II toxin-antitoxin system VapC family toxin [Candidatus Obscuribacterales bacterium]